LQIIVQQQEHIQRLEDEIRRLKGGPQRPQLKPSSLESGKDLAENNFPELYLRTEVI